MRSLRRMRLAALAAGVLLLAGMGGCSLFEPVVGTREGNLALDFTLTDGNDASFSLSDYAGNVVWIQFLNKESEPCQLEAEESMEEFYTPYAAEGLMILTVLVGNDADGDAMTAADAALWATQYGLTFPVLYDEWDGGPWEAYREIGHNRAYYVPLNVIVARDGTIWYKSDVDAGYSSGGSTYRNTILYLLAR